MMQKVSCPLRRNIFLTYIFSFFSCFFVIMPIIIPMFLNKNISMKSIFELQAIFGITVAILEVPSGYICDLIGRKKILQYGSLLYAIGFTWLKFSHSYIDFVCFEIIVASGMALISGADLSLIYESLNQINQDRLERTRAVANIQLAKVGAESLAALCSGLLIMHSMGLVLTIQAIFSWAPFISSFFLKEVPYQKMNQDSHFTNIKFIFQHLFKEDKLISLIFINLIIWSISTFLAVWIFQKYWIGENISIKFFGLLWASYNLSVGVVGKYVPLLEQKLGVKSLLILLSLLPIIGYLGMAFYGGYAGVLLGFCFQISRGINQVFLKDALNWRIPNEFRATINSLASLFFRLGFFLIGPFVGYLIDQRGIPYTFQLLAAFFGLLFIFLLLPLVHKVKRVH